VGDDAGAGRRRTPTATASTTRPIRFTHVRSDGQPPGGGCDGGRALNKIFRRITGPPIITHLTSRRRGQPGRTYAIGCWHRCVQRPPARASWLRRPPISRALR
jgi:hypothetical protein